MYQFYINNILYPVAPSKFQVKINNKNEVITLINEGEVNRLKAPGLTDIQVSDLLIPAVKYPFAEYGSAGFQAPSVYLSQLENLKNTKATFPVVLIRKLASRELGWNFSMTCTLEDYTVEDDAGEGVDLKVSLNFKQWVHYGTKTVTFQKSGGKTTTSTKKSRKSASKKGSGGTYTVKKGDCLINIAKKKLGSGNRWKEIYKLNKTTIENAAKKHGKKSSSNGHWIYPGTKLKLPKK
ncbi:LysM peptidoglycan-binding domain-containing protein [Ihubacter massiliensis]|uniref:LysM peptidoglycan-binding domain-containing protein n=1 Tax=Ihubacter massiliensis TaxID=1852367 RepID=UPI0020972E16|nr:LysM peptidoglycan-binding domain-containing protein [Ihubacter massiliensis]MCO7120346.1 LysM peptidoglycan-binding domain-containing protein [Ihubacter massiliensis]